MPLRRNGEILTPRRPAPAHTDVQARRPAAAALRPPSELQTFLAENGLLCVEVAWHLDDGAPHRGVAAVMRLTQDADEDRCAFIDRVEATLDRQDREH